jgi:hypothetical protein
MEASALAQQVEVLGSSLSSNKDAIDPEARKVALEKLIELKRLEQLKAIAESRSNSTYFFGDRCMWPYIVFFSALDHLPNLDFVPTAALGQDPYNIDYAEQIKGGLHDRDGKVRSKLEAAGAATV